MSEKYEHLLLTNIVEQHFPFVSQNFNKKILNFYLLYLSWLWMIFLMLEHVKIYQFSRKYLYDQKNYHTSTGIPTFYVFHLLISTEFHFDS